MEHANCIEAKTISEALLARTGDAILSGDFETFAQCFSLPHFIATADCKTTLRTRTELRAVFDRVHEDYRRKRVTDLVRQCDVAEYRSQTRIEATHTTHMMSGPHRLMDPFPAFSVLELTDGAWRCAQSQYALDEQTTVGRALQVTFEQSKNQNN